MDGVEVSDGRCGVGKRLLDGWGNGCEKVVVEWRFVVSVSVLGNGCMVFELALSLPRSRADVRPWAEQGRVALRYATLKRKANGLPPAPVGSCAQIVPKLSKALAPPRARRGKSAAVEKWLKRQLEFRDEQRIPGAIGGGKGPA